MLVTGGLGFIGSNLARRLVELGSNVTVVDSMLPNTGANLFNVRGIEDKLHVRVMDLRDGERLAELLLDRDIVFNLAGKCSHPESMSDPVADLEANVHAHVSLLEAIRRVNMKVKVVYASTRQVYGRPVRTPVDETHPVTPIDVNGINKSTGETYHTLYHTVYGLDAVSLRLTNTFGPRMRIQDARLNFLGIWLRKVVQNDAFEIWGGKQFRDMTFIEDAVDAFLAVAACSNLEHRVFNIGGFAPIALSDLAELLIGIAGTGRAEIKEFPSDRLLIDLGNYSTDDRLFRETTGWTPKVSLKDALAQTIAFYRENLNDYI